MWGESEEEVWRCGALRLGCSWPQDAQALAFSRHCCLTRGGGAGQGEACTWVAQGDSMTWFSEWKRGSGLGTWGERVRRGR